MLIDKKRQEPPKKICSCCGKEKREIEFYKSASYINKKTGRLATCKECVIDFYDYMYKSYKKDVRRTIIEVCRVLDVYYEEGLLESVLIEVTGTKTHFMQKYMGKVNSTNHCKNLTFSDSKIDTQVGKIEQTEEIKEVSQTLISKWGAGIPVELYQVFEKMYNEIAPIYNVDNPLKRIYLVKFIKYTVLSDYHLSENDFKKSKEYSSLAKEVAQDGQLNPKEFSKINSGGINSLSELIKMVEEEVDIIETMPIYTKRPKDKLDFTIWVMINYLRRLEDLPEVEYSDLFKFYDDMEKSRKNTIVDLERQNKLESQNIEECEFVE